MAVNADAVTVPTTSKLVNVPTLVMLACALPVTATAVPEVATFKLATCVVDVTVNGADQ